MFSLKQKLGVKRIFHLRRDPPKKGSQYRGTRRVMSAEFGRKYPNFTGMFFFSLALVFGISGMFILKPYLDRDDDSFHQDKLRLVQLEKELANRPK